jgi:hypothetical protein
MDGDMDELDQLLIGQTLEGGWVGTDSCWYVIMQH